MMISKRNLMTNWRKNLRPKKLMLKESKMSSKKLKKKPTRL